MKIFLNKLLEQKPDLTRSDLEQRIQQKKEKIGAGYLTDQGALFLIASDLGISLTEPLQVAMGLKDLYVGAKEVSLETRVLNISPAKQFSRKDGSPFFLRTMTVYDGDATASVKLWDEKANLPGIEDIKPGDLIKIIKAYVKSDLRGAPTINIGSGSNIETSDEIKSDIPSLEAITKDVSTIQEGQKDLVVTGQIDGVINLMEFTNSRGQPSKALRLRLKGQDGNSVRVVLWGKDDASLPKIISPGARTRLLGVRTKLSNQGGGGGSGELELHGNEATILEVEGQKEATPLVVRILSISKNDSGKTMVLGTDNNKNMFNIVDSTDSLGSFQEGQVVECMPSKVFGKSITIDEESFVRKIDVENVGGGGGDGNSSGNTYANIPTLSDMRTKISDVKSGGDYCVEAIILKIPDRREVLTKSGETVSLSEMFVEDDSGQIWIKGWRNQARLIDKCSLGEIISVTAVNARSGLEGRTELFLTPFSKITKKN